jgi:hypothetical protein
MRDLREKAHCSAVGGRGGPDAWEARLDGVRMLQTSEHAIILRIRLTAAEDTIV